jgi:hypothetical protein
VGEGYFVEVYGCGEGGVGDIAMGCWGVGLAVLVHLGSLMRTPSLLG